MTYVCDPIALGVGADAISVSVHRGLDFAGKVGQSVASAVSDVAEQPKPLLRPGRDQSARWKKNMHPSGLRRVTERRVAHLLMRSPGLTRLEVSRQTSLSVTAIGKIIDALVIAGVVEKFAAKPTKPGPTLGRPAEYFALARSRPRHVAVQLNVKNTQVAALPIAGPVGDIQTAQFRTSSDFKAFERRLTAAVGMLDIDEPLAVLVSVPGVVDEQTKQVLYSPNLHWSEGTQLVETIERAIPGRVVFVQEIRALALGNLVRSDPNDSFLMIDTGFGVGGAVVVDGQLQYGPLPLSAEIGHTPIHGNRRVCGCGGVGCLETILGRRGLLRTVRGHLNPNVRTWAQLVSELAGKPVPKCLHATFTDTARVIAGALNTAGVAKIVISGDLVELGESVIEYLTDKINSHALWGRFGAVGVEAVPRQRLLGLARAGLDRAVLEPSAAEEALGRRAREMGAQ